MGGGLLPASLLWSENKTGKKKKKKKIKKKKKKKKKKEKKKEKKKASHTVCFTMALLLEDGTRPFRKRNRCKSEAPFMKAQGTRADRVHSRDIKSTLEMATIESHK